MDCLRCTYFVNFPVNSIRTIITLAYTYWIHLRSGLCLIHYTFEYIHSNILGRFFVRLRLSSVFHHSIRLYGVNPMRWLLQYRMSEEKALKTWQTPL